MGSLRRIWCAGHFGATPNRRVLTLPPSRHLIAAELPISAIRLIGWLVAHTPEFVLRALSGFLGDALFVGVRSRRRLLLSNLHHAFPGEPRGWHRRVARQSCRRMIETALLSLATPHLPERRIREIARLAPSVERLALELAARPRPVVLATLHLALWESQTWLKLLSAVPLPEFGILFRPLDNPSIDSFVKRTRERFGMRLLSRKDGFAAALHILRGNGCVGVLFDQNAGERGALTLLFDRVCSTTELPGLLARKTGADVRTFYPRRTGFWRVSFESSPVAHDGSVGGITLALNRWLESALAGDQDLCESWLWIHDRWRNQDVPSRRLRLESKRSLLDADLAARRLAALPHRTRIWIRMPNWLGDVVMAAPLIRSIRASRPDAEITALIRAAFAPLVSDWRIADRVVPLPSEGRGYWPWFARRRNEFPDVWILLTNSLRGDIEAVLMGAPQRFGLVRPGKRRPLLTHSYRVDPDYDERRHHQVELWEKFLRHFGLVSPIDRSPLPAPSVPEFRSDDGAAGFAGRNAAIGLVPGSENNPEKRWPVANWRSLIDGLPEERFVVLGTANDLVIARQVVTGFDPERVENAAGRTDLPAFVSRLRNLQLLVTNDTGGMHLANGLGVPVVALFGPTNPVRTGPLFAAPARVVQPPGCPATGGLSLADLSPETVIAAISEVIAKPAKPNPAR